MTTQPASQVLAACPDHRALVEAALDGAADDATLERYAEEVPSCAACQRSLAGRLSVHPTLLDRASRGGLDELAAVLGTEVAPSDVVEAAPARRRTGLALIALVTAGFAAAAAWWMTTTPAPVVAPAPAPSERIALPSPRQAPAPPAVVEAPTLPPPRIAATPRPVVLTPAPPVAPPTDDGVAEVDPVGEADWPPPPYEDLAGGTAKGAGAVRAVQLVVSGTPVVGGTVSIATVAASSTELQVCVEGPERGVVWRGRVPAGRTPLTRGERPASFAFAAPGVYRFVAGLDPGVADCAPPVHVVEVEVAP
ncbi:MAG: hypothetical protein KC621_29395 [Myxococcales bacterium]|nr:hypothetical protein [Myxococcales bacterium]